MKKEEFDIITPPLVDQWDNVDFLLEDIDNYMDVMYNNFQKNNELWELHRFLNDPDPVCTRETMRQQLIHKCGDDILEFLDNKSVPQREKAKRHLKGIREIIIEYYNELWDE